MKALASIVLQRTIGAVGRWMEKDLAKWPAFTDQVFQTSRKDVICADIARRLRRVCSELAEEDFKMLVEQMAEQQLRSERREIT